MDLSAKQARKLMARNRMQELQDAIEKMAKAGESYIVWHALNAEEETELERLGYRAVRGVDSFTISWR